MTMTKEALEFLDNQSVKAAEKAVFEVGEDTFLIEDGRVRRFEPNDAPQTIESHTLSGVVTAIKENLLGASVKSIQVVSPTKVLVFGKVDNFGNRPELASVEAITPEFPFESYLDQEKFQIKMRANFIANDHRDILIKFAGDVTDTNEQSYSDDGITQRATVKDGVASKAVAEVPSPAVLKPYRTFNEVAQPESEFIYRIKKSDGDIYMALFEADGGAWANEAMANVAAYLEAALPVTPVIA
ncbi:hypothetical protein WOSG25_180320 [Weissella oryzae SG25]|uniref:Phage protein n=1 Tax=Weissella oryzae (strain DSM 25784 / JCM 18191 / LMG 30913 / SG25) TaxID=1329250 RepID=A0A069D3C1_WEIOS|nr:hypothetical protein [Weissella oryzae]GAK31881.1 hypothetical protein WOSG25_180320 [Weissella oryzae SG25]